MSVDELLDDISTAATVIGFIVLAMFLATFICMAGVWYDNWSYKRARQRKHDVEWDNVRSKWLDEHITVERKSHRTDTLEHPVTRQDQIDTDEIPSNPQRSTTDIMDIEFDQLVDTYQKEHYRDAS